MKPTIRKTTTYGNEYIIQLGDKSLKFWFSREKTKNGYSTHSAYEDIFTGEIKHTHHCFFKDMKRDMLEKIVVDTVNVVV